MIPDSLRLAVGTFTILPVPPPRRIDRRIAGSAMLWGPLVGLVLAVCAAVLMLAVRWIPGHSNPFDVDAVYTRVLDPRGLAIDLLAAVAAVALLAWLTRALHLDGLADTADGFGVKGTGPDLAVQRLAVMRQPDTGAFGWVAVAFVLLLQVTALLLCLVTGHGTVALITAVVTGRLAATWGATPALAPAREGGLGASVAGSVGVRAAILLTVMVLAGAAGLGALDDDATVRLTITLVVAVMVGLAVAAVVLRRCVRAFSGVTGDVFGATIELTSTAVLVTVALLG